MAVLRRRTRDPRGVAVMVAGGILGLALLATMGPRSPGDLPAVPVAQPEVGAVREPAVAVVPPNGLPTPHPRDALTLPNPEPQVSNARSAERMEQEDTGSAQVASLVVDIVDPGGRPAEGGSVLAIDCPGFQSREGGFYEADAGTCTLQAVRRDGLLFARSTRESVELREGEIAYLQLELQSTRTGGVGVRFRPTHMGMQVLQVVPGTPAWESGLEPGDVIVSVDGTAVTELSANAFVEAMTGPVGSDVQFTVRYPSDEGTEAETLTVQRTFLDG